MNKVDQCTENEFNGKEKFQHNQPLSLDRLLSHFVMLHVQEYWCIHPAVQCGNKIKECFRRITSIKTIQRHFSLRMQDYSPLLNFKVQVILEYMRFIQLDFDDRSTCFCHINQLVTSHYIKQEGKQRMVISGGKSHLHCQLSPYVFKKFPIIILNAVRCVYKSEMHKLLSKKLIISKIKVSSM